MGGIYELRVIMPKPPRERVDICTSILKTEKDDSLRVESLWVLADTFLEIPLDSPMRDEIAELLEFVLKKDNNDVVKHEACYLIGENNLRNKIPTLRNAVLHDPSDLVRHEAIEALGLLQDFTSKDVLRKSMEDPVPSVSQTATIVLKQLERAEKANSIRQI